MPRLLHVIEDADMRCRHDGLRDWAKKNKVDFRKFQPGDIVAFLNTSRTHLAILVALKEEGSLGLLGQYRSPAGRVPPEAFEFISEALGSNGFQMDAAIKKGLEKILRRGPGRRGVAGDPSERVRRLARRIRQYDIKQAWLEERMGVARSTLFRWFSGQIANPEEGMLAALEKLVESVVAHKEKEAKS